jgi:hypothetical protein
LVGTKLKEEEEKESSTGFGTFDSEKGKTIRQISFLSSIVILE